MNLPCIHAASGCDYPASECAGHCASRQPESLRLADALGDAPKWQQLQAAAELRRLHALNAELLESLKEVTFLLEASLRLRGDPDPGSIGAKARAAIAKATQN